MNNPQTSPLVSVVVPVYNMEQYVGDTLNSILKSSYNNFEVIVVDDGSKDNSYDVCQKIAASDKRVKLYRQTNGGACRARNKAVEMAKGEWILPVDADNLIEPFFISNAISLALADNEVKVVAPRADFFGDRSGEWLLAPFSLKRIAHKNIMDTCALYRRSEWERVGGYSEEIIAREDWDFWISILKDGGKVVKLKDIVLHYRVRQGSKRVSDRDLKHHVIDVLNKRHPEFFEKQLGGPLRYQRSWSKSLNLIYRFFHPRKIRVAQNTSERIKDFVSVMPIHFANDGKVIYKGRNELRQFEIDGEEFVVKSFRTPNIINRIVYGLFRSSKAERSYLYAKMLCDKGFFSPEPIAFYTQRNGLLFTRSYYMSRKSECAHTYAELSTTKFEHKNDILRSVARTTARFHEAGMLHTDYSRGNLLFNDEAGNVKIEIIDLNRIRFRKVGMEEGCKNFERLPMTEDVMKLLASEYAKARGFDETECFNLIKKYNTGER